LSGGENFYVGSADIDNQHIHGEASLLTNKRVEVRVSCFGFLVSGFGFQMSQVFDRLKPEL
jgi:hypothetical protein